jgi:hypothetical protein
MFGWKVVRALKPGLPSLLLSRKIAVSPALPRCPRHPRFASTAISNFVYPRRPDIGGFLADSLLFLTGMSLTVLAMWVAYRVVLHWLKFGADTAKKDTEALMKIWDPGKAFEF